MRLSVFRGIDLRLTGAPDPSVTDKAVASAALVGADYLGLRPAFAVEEGDQVKVGQVLFTDRTHPQIAFVAPLAGRVASIGYGPRRSLSALVIHRDADETDGAVADAPVDTGSGDAVREALLSRGLWPAFRTRPFGQVPAPDASPRAIFVTATVSEPLAPDPRSVLALSGEGFRRGTELLTKLTDGPVHVCQPPGPPLANETQRVRIASFDGRHPAGLAGTHVHALHPVTPDRAVWTIDCQDVAAIGHLAETGRYDPARIVTLSGPGATRPRLVRTVAGASLRELAAGEDTGRAPARVLSGSALSGCDAAWLGRYHRQVTVIEAAPQGAPRRHGRGGRQRPRPIIPTAALEHALPAGFLPIPLIRALAVGDAEAAVRLGALNLIEEDMALLSALCSSGADYGALLRNVLNTLEDAA